MKKIERRRRRERESNCLEKKKNKKRDQIIIIMLQKAKTIKKTIKTEVKAIVHGQERVDKRGKPVTSIADRTNVRAAHKTLFFFIHISSFHRVSSLRNERKVFLSWRKCPLLCVLLPREEDTKHTKKFFRVFSSTPAASRKTTEKRRDTFYDDDHHHHHHHRRRPDAACFLFFPFIYRRSFRNLSRRKSTRNWKTRA